jgi:hypothetical protein
MTPYEFGYAVGMEKNANIFAQLARRAGQAGKTLGTAAQTINTGAKHLVKGTGGVVSGLGHVAAGAGQVGKGVGRGMMQLGQRTNALGDNLQGGILKDLLNVAGHGTRAVGRVLNTTGSGAGLLGKGLQGAGSGLGQVSQMGYGVPTLAAAGLGYGASAVAPDVPTPTVRFQNPVDFNFSLRKPVDVQW